MKTAVVLGAGFSRFAGFPLVDDINARFESFDPEWDITTMGSGEIGWRTEIGERRFIQPYDTAFGYYLKELIAASKVDGHSFNYEGFFDFVRKFGDNEGLGRLHSIREEVEAALRLAHPEWDKRSYVKGLPRNPRSILPNLNGLVSDLLRKKRVDVEIDAYYSPFLNYLRAQSSYVCITTLNHDLLLEGQLRSTGITYSDGFSEVGSNVEDHFGRPIASYQDVFTEPWEILKLHGSIDLYRFEEHDEIDLTHSFVTGRFQYIKPKDHDAKWFAKTKGKPQRSGGVVSTNPEFISGLDKPWLIQQGSMYKSLFDRAAEQMRRADHLYIIGYGFNDKHITKMIREALADRYVERVTIINPNNGLDAELNPRSLSVERFKDLADVPLT